MKRRKPKPFTRENVLTPDERKRLLDATNNDYERLIVYGLLYTGMRESEFLHMRKSWVNFEEGVISVPLREECKICSLCKKSKTRKNKLIKPADTWQAKTKHAERPIPIVPEVKDIFLNYFKGHGSIIETVWYRQNIWSTVVELGKRARIRHPVFPHALRGTFATILVEKGLEDSVTLKDVMGWKSLAMATEYIKIGGTAMKKRIDKIW